MLCRLSLKVAELPDSDLLRVIFLLGHRRIQLQQMRIQHISTDTLDRKHTQTQAHRSEDDRVGSIAEGRGTDSDTDRTGAARTDSVTDGVTNRVTDSVTDVLTEEGGSHIGGAAGAAGVGAAGVGTGTGGGAGKRSLLDVLDMRLEAVLPDLSPGTVQYSMVEYRRVE